MKELEPDARRRLDRYLDQVRATLRGARSVDPTDVEADIQAHIQSELAEAAAPVSLSALDAVLDRLGSPIRWVPEEDLAAWRRLVARWRSGPEDWRLAYLTTTCFFLGLVLAALEVGPLGGLLMLASYLVARAARTLADETGEDFSAKRWLIDPPLVVAHGLLLFGVLALPVVLLIGLSAEVIAPEAARFPELIAKHALLVARIAEANDPLEMVPAGLGAAHVLLAVIGPWILLLGLGVRRWPDALRRLLVPLGGWLDRRAGTALVLTGAGICVLALAAYAVNS